MPGYQVAGVKFNLQPILKNDQVYCQPLITSDFERLYAVASDPLIWEQHPNPDRYRRTVFENYFKGAIDSGGALLVTDVATNEVIGSSRFYDLAVGLSKISIGYTFLGRKFWGKGCNRMLKILMLDHAFQFVDRTVFYVGASNRRSRRAMEKLGGKYIGEETLSYYGELAKPNVIYAIDKIDWLHSAAE